MDADFCVIPQKKKRTPPNRFYWSFHFAALRSDSEPLKNNECVSHTQSAAQPRHKRDGYLNHCVVLYTLCFLGNFLYFLSKPFSHACDATKLQKKNRGAHTYSVSKPSSGKLKTAPQWIALAFGKKKEFRRTKFIHRFVVQFGARV